MACRQCEARAARTKSAAGFPASASKARIRVFWGVKLLAGEYRLTALTRTSPSLIDMSMTVPSVLDVIHSCVLGRCRRPSDSLRWRWAAVTTTGFVWLPAASKRSRRLPDAREPNFLDKDTGGREY